MKKMMLYADLLRQLRKQPNNYEVEIELTKELDGKTSEHKEEEDDKEDK